MTQKTVKPTDPADVIAMPPLKMTLVHAKDARAHNVNAVSSLRQAFESESPIGAQVDPESIKKIIEHLNKKE